LRKRISGSFSEGVALAELIIVLACAGILLTSAVPSFNHLRHQWSLWGAAHLLESSLQWGRFHAISANTSMMLMVDNDGQRFYWVDGYTGERFERTERHLPGQVRITSSPRRPLRFYQRGNAVPAGTFVLEGESGTYRVIVNSAGRVRLEHS
jgi:type II secretory pathway pseudopilin PulG